MCLIALALGLHPRWPLVIASNRDEYRARPTAPLARWTAGPGHDVVSGRDLEAGGTWLGFTPAGRFAMVTNVRQGAAAQGPRSRGELALRWLTASTDIADFKAAMAPQDYAGFNLIVGDVQRGDGHYLSNAGSLTPQRLVERPMGPGLYGLSNAALDEPWPKTLALKARLQDALVQTSDTGTLQAQLLAALQDRTPAPPGQQPRTGVPAPVESALSSAWVSMPEAGYGTRCSTVAIAETGPAGLQLTVSEWRYRADGTVDGRSDCSLSW